MKIEIVLFQDGVSFAFDEFAKDFVLGSVAGHRA